MYWPHNSTLLSISVWNVNFFIFFISICIYLKKLFAFNVRNGKIVKELSFTKNLPHVSLFAWWIFTMSHRAYHFINSWPMAYAILQTIHAPVFLWLAWQSSFSFSYFVVEVSENVWANSVNTICNRLTRTRLMWFLMMMRCCRRLIIKISLCVQFLLLFLRAIVQTIQVWTCVCVIPTHMKCTSSNFDFISFHSVLPYHVICLLLFFFWYFHRHN